MKFLGLVFLAGSALVTGPAFAKTTHKTAKIQPKVTLQWPRISRANQDDYFYHIGALQHLLNFRGAKIGVDGGFGVQTETALKSFQRKHGLKADGVAGPETLPKLIVPLKRGDKGKAVEAIQSVFEAYMSEGESAIYAVGKRGVFDRETEKGARQWQVEAGLKSDGVVGPQTWCDLLGGKVIKHKK